MSDPTRYYPAGDGVVRTDPKGPLVNYHYYEELKTENARLKADAEIQTERIISLEDCITVLKQDRDSLLYDESEQITRLKAEVERLKSEPDALTAYLYADTLRRDDIKTLKAQVERLTKAGDNLVYVVTEHPVAEPFVKAWFAVKEGKQP